MPVPSTVKRLPPQIRDEIHGLLDSGRTLDEIIAHLRTLGVDEVSRSALGRYKQNFDKVMERVRRSREIADSLVRNFGQEPESKSARANIEIMHSVVSDLLLQAGDPDAADPDADASPVTLDTRQVHDLAKALDHLSRARRHDQDALVKAREEAAAAAAKEAASRMEMSARKAGVSPEVIRMIRRDVLRMDE